MMSFIRKLLIWVLLIPAVLLGALLACPQFAGLQVCSVHSGDIPDYRPGSLLYVQQADPGVLNTGAAITYMVNQEEVQTHLIAGVVADEENPAELRFRTKRDAADAEDPTLVYYRNVLGVPVMAIPLLGYVLDWLKTPSGFCAAAAAGVLWLLLVLLPLFFRGKKKQNAGKYLR